MEGPRLPAALRWLGLTLLVAGAYLALARLGLRVVVISGQVSPVWPPAGLALAALALWGRRAAPGVWLGGLAATLSSGATLGPALGIASSNLVEALVGAALLTRLAVRPALERTRDVVGLSVAVAASTAVGGLLGAAVMGLSGLAPWGLYPRMVGVWWVGDAIGGLMVAPLLLAGRTVRPWALPGRALLERALLGAGLLGVGAFVFGAPAHPGTGLYAQSFLIMPFILWAALRMQVGEAALATLLISTIATVATARGLGPFATQVVVEGVLVLQLFMAVVSLTGLLLGSARAESQRAAARLALLAAAVRSTEEGVLILRPGADGQPRVHFANRGFCRLSGLSPEQVREGSPRLLAGPSTPPDVFARLEEASRTGRSFVEEVPLARADGSPFMAELQLSPLHDEERGVAGPHSVLTVRDVSRRHQMQAQLALAERMASVGRLAAGVAHEVNTPLAWLLTHLEALRRQLRAAPPGAPLAVEALLHSVERAQEGGERVRDIVRDLKVFAREEREERTAVDLNAVVETALTLTRNELSHRARVVQHQGPVPAVRGNRARLEQVVVNLLVNAAQAIPEDSGQAHTVEVETGREASGRALLRVRDSGVGIRPEDLPRIFEPFFTTKQVGEGTGLGLSICHEIITGLGGTISVESTPGRGTTVSVLLPGEEGLPAALPQPPPPPPPSAAGPRRVLIVDDEVRMGLSMRLLLQPEHEVATTTSAAEALAWVQQGQPFDVILCDLQMPHMSGMELYARLQEVAPQAAERMVFLTGGAFTSAAREFVRTVPNPVLEKPVPPEALLAAIASAPRSLG